MNFGMAHDRTEHVLWRIVNGEFDFECEPKIVVVLVGTNNAVVASHTAENIAEAIETIVDEIRRRLASAHILVVEIPPRGRAINRVREKIARVNQLLRTALADGTASRQRVTLLSCSTTTCDTTEDDDNHDFLDDSTIAHADMFDYLNFTSDGYRKFCEPLLHEINSILSNSTT